jgi:hypothetical protein
MTRAQLAAKLLAIVDWLDAAPDDGENDRELVIEIGVSSKPNEHATVDLHLCRLAKRRPGQHEDDRALVKRHYGAESGRSVADAISRLRVPRAARR